MLVFPSKLPQHSDSQQGDSACGRGHYTKSSRVLTQGCRAALGDRAPQTQAAWLRGALSHCPPPSPPFVPVRIRNLIHNFKSEEAEAWVTLGWGLKTGGPPPESAMPKTQGMLSHFLLDLGVSSFRRHKLGKYLLHTNSVPGTVLGARTQQKRDSSCPQVRTRTWDRCCQAPIPIPGRITSNWGPLGWSTGYPKVEKTF